MVIDDSKTDLNSISKRHNFEFLKAGDDISQLIKRLTLNISQSPEKDLFNAELIRFAKQLHGKYNLIKSTRCKREFVTACKARSEEISDIISNLSVIKDITNVRVAHNENGSIIELLHDETVIWRKRDYYPKIYKILIDLVLQVLKSSYIELSQKYEYLRVIASVSAIYNDIRPNREEILEQEREAIERLSQDPVLVDYAKFCDNARLKGSLESELLITIRDIRRYADSNYVISQIPPVYRDIVNAVRRMRLSFPNVQYDNANEPNYSFASCGIYINKRHRRESIPALLASVYEEDWAKDYIPEFDDVTGFNLEYGQLREQVKNKLTSYKEVSISIKQKKFSRRVIHITNNCVQDRLNFYHRRVATLLRYTKCDCTFNQAKGIRFIKDATSKNSHNIYCLDWSKATDTMLSEVQAIAMRQLVLSHYNDSDADKLISAWLKLVRMQMTFKLSNNNEISFHIKAGQPQGFLSSFPAFSLLHHVIMITNYRITYGINTNVIGLYRVLGDDSGFLSIGRDENANLLKEQYIQLSNAVNVECNPNKGYIFEGEGSPIGEFAKVKCVDGVYFTNTPLNIVSRAGLSTEDALRYILWLKKYTDCNIDKDNLIEKLEELHPVSQAEATVITHLLNSSLPNEINLAFDYEKPGVDDINITDYVIFRQLLIETLNKSIISSILPDGLREEPEDKQRSIGLSKIREFNKLDLSKLENNMRSKLAIIAFQDTFFSAYIEKFGYKGLDAFDSVRDNDMLKSVLTFATIKRFDLSNYLDIIMEILSTESPDEIFLSTIHAVITDGSLERLVKSFNERSWHRSGKFIPDRFSKLYNLLLETTGFSVINELSEDDFEKLLDDMSNDLFGL